MLSLSAFTAFLPLTTLIAVWAVKRVLLAPRVRTFKRATEIRRLLHPPDVSLEDLLYARAMPNQRLVHAFRLTNTFVSGDAKVHKTFTASAKELIAGGGDQDHRWRAVVLSAEASVHRFLPVENTAIQFSVLIQCITFAVVLSALFHADLDALDYDDVVHATRIINERWRDSKIKDAAAMQQDESLRSLTAHLERWIVDRDRYPNPLNLILPAYETMWRVVAATVAYAYRFRDNAQHEAVVAFGKDLTEESFVAFGLGGDGLPRPSMQSIVLEVLRLHPPTRHIVRTSTRSKSRSWWCGMSNGAVDVADIEAVHRTDEYGEKTAEFDPMRFHPSRMRSTGERVELLYSFGYGRLKCIAAGWAPMAVGIISATIVLQMEEEGCTMRAGPKIGGRSGWDGWLVSKEARA